MDEIYQFGYFIKKFGRDTIVYFPAKMIPGLAIIFFTAIFTRVFKPEFYGQYVIIITTTTIVTAIFSHWLSQAVLRYRAQYISKNTEFTFNLNLFKLLIVMTMLLLLLFFLFFPFKKMLGQYEKFYLVFLLIIIVDIWFTVSLAIFQADTRANIFTLYTILNAIFKLGISLFLVFVIKMDVSGLLWGTFLSSFVLIIPIILTIFVYKKPSDKYTEENKQKTLFISLFKQFFGYGFPMVGWFIGSELLMVSDRYFIQIFRGSNEVGIYSTNYSLISSAISFITIPLLNAAHPLIMKANVDSSFKLNEIKKLISVFSRYFLLSVFPVVTYIVLLKDELVRIFLGFEYRTGSVIFPILAPGIFLWFFAMFGHKGLELREKTSRMFLYVVICAIMKLILNLLLIPPYGYKGAAVTTLVCLSLYPVMVYFGTKNDIEWIIPWITFIKLAIVLSALIGCVYVIKYLVSNYILVLIISAFAVAIVYTIMLFILQEIKAGEMSAVKIFLKRVLKL